MCSPLGIKCSKDCSSLHIQLLPILTNSLGNNQSDYSVKTSVIYPLKTVQCLNLFIQKKKKSKFPTEASQSPT